MKKLFNVAVFLISLSIVGPVSVASELPKPTDKVILSVSGQIDKTNKDGHAEFDLAMLDALPQTTLTVETPWTEGNVSFSGPLLRDFLDMVGASGNVIQAKALNDYMVVIPMEDVQEFDVILATSLDGKRLSVRDKGPVWIIYPWNDDEDLRVETYYARSIWQLKSMVIE
ncbi:molybdopterin-dependent oxidoreductase [Curvivirga aplysinae]|uniref:molybdopterin-dependent oxidoreductase n=1 Tax=Curvivirga aplysinae TaxID=2529852 RepID=UPI001C3FEA1D|nr:molybdopterin-dependent oxidoreductase [Curvivirga aplysinae]